VSVRDLLASATRRLGGDAARLEAELLLAHALGVSRAWLYAWPEHEPSAEVCDAFERQVAARERGEPIAYLIGRREFRSLDLEVTPDVLIPRPETELLVELALARMPLDCEASVADLGTGSGAIALAIASERPRTSVVATDVSAAALAVAQGNATRLGLRNATFAQGDWCKALGGARFDMIVSNPPYVAEGDPHLDAGDLRYEPIAALVSGADGLDAIRRIVAEVPAHLEAGGWLLLEHGWDQAASVRALLEAGEYADIASECDHAGHERVTLGRRIG
jgi:release factor glutamine methyltransferase